MKEPKVTIKDRAKFPKVQDEYEKRIKKSYSQMVITTMNQFLTKLEKHIS